MLAYDIEHVQDTDRLVCAEPCYVGGFLLQVETTANIVEIYDGLDATSGKLIHSMEGTENVPIPVFYGGPAKFGRGLFVHIVHTGDMVDVVYKPISDVPLE